LTQFHFAGIQSVWIRRALVAAGFGRGALSSGLPIEIGHSTLPYHDVTTLATDRRAGPSDEEAIDLKRKEDSPHSGADADGGLLSPDTPFFHIDLFAAVRAAESAVGERS
jgi:sodium-independent sulfate anion transporter 11